jgi:hypothetical protein
VLAVHHRAGVTTPLAVLFGLIDLPDIIEVEKMQRGLAGKGSPSASPNCGRFAQPFGLSPFTSFRASLRAKPLGKAFGQNVTTIKISLREG